MPRATGGSIPRETLLAAGADIEQADANGITPLLMAITNNHMDVARFLIDRGAAINVSDWYGRTPLWAAVETRNMDVDNAEPFENGVDRGPVLDLIRILLERGADPNTADERDAADSAADAAHHGLAGVGGLHRSDAVSHRLACRAT